MSIVHIVRGTADGPRYLNYKEVPTITAFLFSSGGHDDPNALAANADIAFIGSQPYGMGFTFDDTDTSGVANSLAEMNRLVKENPKNSERIFPFIGFAEVANSPTHAFRRYIIDFGEMTEEQARKWPDLLRIVEEKVKPARAHLTTNTVGRKRAETWWQYGAPAKGLYQRLDELERVLVAGSQASAHFAFAWLPTGYVYSSNLTVITSASDSMFAIIQSRVHESWARFFMTTLEDRLVYTPTTCFETFPFPENWKDASLLCDCGLALNEFRSEVMCKEDKGLTKTYNRFHDPYETSSEIKKLRDLHDEMDRAVLRAYGWEKLAEQATCEFLLDYEEEEDDDPTAKKSKKKKPWRYRWPDEFRDEVLARLLELNEQRAMEEKLAGKAAEERKSERPKRRTVTPTTLPGLFNDVELTDTDRMALIVVSAWGEQTWVDRLLFGQALLLWKNNRHRQYLLGRGEEPKRKPASVGSIPQIIGRAINQGWIRPRESEGIQWLCLSQVPSPVGQLSAVEQSILQEVRSVVQRIRESDEIIIEQTEDSIRATKEFV